MIDTLLAHESGRASMRSPPRPYAGRYAASRCTVPANVDDDESAPADHGADLRAVADAAGGVPVHPRSREAMTRLAVGGERAGIRLVEPLAI